MGGMRTEVMRGDPMDDRPRKIGGHTRRHVDDGRARLEAGAATPRMIGRVRLEAMRDWSLCTVSKFGVLAVHHFRR